jgi:hypothetical protein
LGGGGSTGLGGVFAFFLLERNLAVVQEMDLRETSINKLEAFCVRKRRLPGPAVYWFEF